MYLFATLFLACFFFLLKKINHRRAVLPLSGSFLVSEQKSKRTKARLYLYRLGPWCFYAAVTMIALSLLPIFTSSSQQIEEAEVPQTGKGIYLAIDISGSMVETTPFAPAYAHKEDWVKDVAKKLILEYKNNPIGIITLARSANVLAPLTLDTASLLKSVQNIHPVTAESDDGTAIGYALYKVANLIVSAKYFESRGPKGIHPIFSMNGYVIILLTDGLQSPNPADRLNPYRFLPLQDALVFCQKNGIQVYYIAVDPVLKLDQYINETKKTMDLIEQTGGIFTFADHMDDFKLPDDVRPAPLHSGFAAATPQNSSFPIQRSLLGYGMCLMFFACLIETIFARRGP